VTTLDALTSPTTATITVHVTRAITTRIAKVLCEGWVVHRGSRMVTTEGRLNDDQGRLLAHASATYALGPR
jgi:acyl-coenzyme A thioesterase PaaI-like protein